MKTTAKFVEIIGTLTGATVGAKVEFNENTYELAEIDSAGMTATALLKCEGQEDVSIDFQELIDSEDYVVEACKKEEKAADKEDDEKELDEEGNPFAKKDDDKDDDKKDDKKDDDSKDDDKKDDSEDDDDDEKMKEKKKK